MGGTEGAKHISRLDRKVDTLPGQDGLELVSTAVGRFGVGPKAVQQQPQRPGLAARLLPEVRRVVESARVAVF